MIRLTGPCHPRPSLCYTCGVAKRQKIKKSKKGLFETIRKPIAPPSQKLDSEKRNVKLDPVRRKAKHKRPGEEELDV